MTLLVLSLGLLGYGPFAVQAPVAPSPGPTPVSATRAAGPAVGSLPEAIGRGERLGGATGPDVYTWSAALGYSVPSFHERRAAPPISVAMIATPHLLSAPASTSIAALSGLHPIPTLGSSGNTGAVITPTSRDDHTPVGTAQSVSTDEDTPISFDLDCVEPDGDTLTYALVDYPINGGVVLVGGTATYTPNADWEGADVFTWRCEDSTGLSSVPVPATVLVEPVNDVPVANNGTLTLVEDNSGSVRLIATDYDGPEALTYTIQDEPTHGLVVLSASTVTYRPVADFNGTDTFTFSAYDGERNSNLATVTVTVTPLDDAPQTVNSAASTTSGVPVSLPAAYIDPDGAEVTVTLVSEPEYGSASLSDTTFLYTPPEDFFGVDTFTYLVTDPTGLVSDTVTMRVNVHPTPTPGRPEMAQFGLNMIQFGLDAVAGEPLSTASEQFQPETIFDTFAELGVQSYRQSQNADLVWSGLMPGDGAGFADEESEEVLTNAEFEPFATLFELQYASPTPPWCTDATTFQRYMSHDAYAYLDHVIEVFGDAVRYYDIGNEVYHWVASYPPQLESGIESMPACYPADGYYPSQQAVFLEEASRYLRTGIPDAVITLPAVNTSDSISNDWLREVMAASGDSDWFDVISYHSYNEWTRLYAMRTALAELITELGLDHKMVKMTEGGSSSDPLRTEKTDYPNSDETQCSDIFRLPLIAWGYGDASYNWHSYIVADSADNGSFAMEVVNHDGTWKPSGYAMQLMTSHLLPFTAVADFSYNERYRFRINTQDGHVRWVMWGSLPAPVPEGMMEYTSVYPAADGSFTWIPVSEGDSVALTDTPILFR